MEELFQQECIAEDEPDPIVKAFKKYDSEFLNLSDKVTIDRQKEKNDLIQKIKSLEAKLKNIKNVKNHRMVEINKKISDKRKQIRSEIENLKDKLEELNMELEGSNSGKS